MVLAELGGKLRDALRKLQTAASGSPAEDEVDQKNRITALVAEITRALIESDVNVRLVMKLRDNILQKTQELIQANANSNNNNQKSKDPQYLSKMIQKIVMDELVLLVSPGGSGANKPHVLKRGKPNIILFVGLQGAGKTTTIAKFASYHAKRGYKVAMVCGDTFRAGALDQLKQNATKLRIPFYGSYTQADPVLICEQGVQKFVKDRYEVILVDTSGRHKQESKLLEEMQELAAVVHPNTTILVMDATQGQAVYDQAVAFHQAVGLGGVIITKLDGHAKGGGALSAVAAAQAPILYLGLGEHFDDLEPFNAQSFVSKLLGFGDVRGLFQAMKDVTTKQSQEEFVQKMEKGQFTIRDMYQQYQNVLNLGPLNRFMPGAGGGGNSMMPDYMMPSNDKSQQQLRRFMVMMDSMTDAELDGKVDLHKKYDPQVESRIRRIAAGSGCHPEEVKLLLLAHKQMESVVVKMGKSGMVGKQAQARQAQFANQVRKNPNLIQQRINQMDPKLLQQMGGRDKVLAMMQQMAKGGGGPGAGGGGGGFDADDPTSMMMPPMPPAGGAGGGMPGMPGIPPGMDMEQLMKMAQAMGLGGAGGGGPAGAGASGFPPGAGGFPGMFGSGGGVGARR